MRAGEVVAGFVIERMLGSGGMGEVYLARHPRLPRRVALKVLGPEFASDQEVRARFEREAELIARLDHPAIVAVYDRGVDEGRLWIAMQFVDGMDAGALHSAKLAPARAIHIVSETARALDHAHEVGVIHRDVKPANIMLARGKPGQPERVLLTDFGIGRLRDDSVRLTRTGTLTATLAYASPEQLGGAPLDAHSDQYSLACTLYRLLCGHTPFEAANAAAVVAGHLHYPPPRVSARRLDLPAALDAVLIRALAKDPADRFGTCGEFALAAARTLASECASAGWLAGEIGSGRTSPAPTTIVYPEPPPPDSVAIPGVRREDAAPPGRGVLPGVRQEDRAPRPALSPTTAGPRSNRRVWAAGGVLTLVVVLTVASGIIWVTKDSDAGAVTSAGGPSSGAAAPAAARLSFEPAFQPLLQVDAQGDQLSLTGSGLDPAGDGKAVCASVDIGMMGAITGANYALGNNVYGGARLAVDRFNKANPRCQVTLRQFDTVGSPTLAGQLAPQVAATDSVIGVIGPVFSGETSAAGQTLSDAGLPFMSLGTNVSLSNKGWRTYFRGTASDDAQAPALTRYLTGTAGYRRVCVIMDNTDYGTGLGAAAKVTMGAAADPACAVTVPAGEDFGPAVERIAAARPDAVLYTGYYPEAAVLLQRLRQAGITAAFATGDGALDPAFTRAAGASMSGTLVSCPCGPATAAFFDEYRALVGSAAGVNSVEAYDLTAILLRGIASGKTSRADLLAFLKNYSGEGLAHHYRWTGTGEPSSPRVWVYRAS